jgi:hypothetical protein
MQGRRLIVAVLGALFLLASSIAFAQGEAGEPSGPPAGEAGTEIVAKRTATSDTYRLPDDSLRTVVFASPINPRLGQLRR